MNPRTEADRIKLGLASWYGGQVRSFKRNQHELTKRVERPGATPPDFAYLQGLVEGKAEVLTSFAAALALESALAKQEPTIEQVDEHVPGVE